MIKLHAADLVQRHKRSNIPPKNENGYKKKGKPPYAFRAGLLD
jgi:hypothetical protein